MRYLTVVTADRRTNICKTSSGGELYGFRNRSTSFFIIFFFRVVKMKESHPRDERDYRNQVSFFQVC